MSLLTLRRQTTWRVFTSAAQNQRLPQQDVSERCNIPAPVRDISRLHSTHKTYSRANSMEVPHDVGRNGSVHDCVLAFRPGAGSAGR